MTLNSKKAAFLILAVFLFVLDRYLKSLALANLGYVFIENYLSFSFAKNFGIAFSLPLGGLLLNWLIIAILFGLIWFMYVLYKQGDFKELLAIFTVFLGALSNLIDRLLLGYVIDYIDLAYFTVFNLADVLILCGVSFYILISIDKKGIVC